MRNKHSFIEQVATLFQKRLLQLGMGDSGVPTPHPVLRIPEEDNVVVLYVLLRGSARLLPTRQLHHLSEAGQVVQTVCDCDELHDDANWGNQNLHIQALLNGVRVNEPTLLQQGYLYCEAARQGVGNVAGATTIRSSIAQQIIHSNKSATVQFLLLLSTANCPHRQINPVLATKPEDQVTFDLVKESAILLRIFLFHHTDSMSITAISKSVRMQHIWLSWSKRSSVVEKRMIQY